MYYWKTKTENKQKQLKTNNRLIFVQSRADFYVLFFIEFFFFFCKIRKLKVNPP